MTTYRTTEPNKRLTVEARYVGKFVVQVFHDFGDYGYRVIDEQGQEVLEVLEGADPDFVHAQKVGLDLVAAHEDAKRKK